MMTSLTMLNQNTCEIDKTSLLFRRYNSFFCLHFNYYCHFWRNNFKSNLKRINILQNRQIKSICKIIIRNNNLKLEL